VVSLPDHLFSSSLTEQQAGRSKGVLFSLVINPKRQGKDGGFTARPVA
jgi:hypothetical protein